MCANSLSGTNIYHSDSNRVLYSQLRNSPMDEFTFDTDLFAEINDSQAEIFDVIEEEKFDVEEFIKGDIDF